MGSCVKFPSSTPIEIVELYRKLDLQRRELEKQRIHAQDNLLKKQGRKIFMNDSHETDDGKKERLTDSFMEDVTQHTDVLTKDLEGNSEQHTDMLSEEEEILETYIFNVDNSYVNYAGKEGQQMKNERETMLAENIVEDHHSNMVIGTMKAEKKDGGDFLSLERDLELQKEDLVTGSSNETIGSCDFEIDNLIVLTGVAEDNPSLGVVLKEDATIVSHMQKLVTVDDREELTCLNSQEKTIGQTFKTATVMKNQNSIMIKDEDTESIKKVKDNY